MGAGLSLELSNTLHVLRELVHLSCGWIALEPRLEAKLTLARHVEEDATSITALREQLSAPYPGAPGDALARRLAPLSGHSASADYLEVAYGELKPALAETLKIQIATIDPLLDEPALRLLTRIRHDQLRHAVELPARALHGVPEPLPGNPVERGWERKLTPFDPVGEPARDAYMEPLASHDGPCARVHDLMAAELAAVELAARASHENPRDAWELHAQRIHEAATHARHVAACDRLLTEELDCRWGHHALPTATTAELLAPTGHAAIDELVQRIAE